MPFNSYGLITTPVLHGSYLEASFPDKRESATVPFWENLLNHTVAGDGYLAVNSQQPVDDTTKAVDIVVQRFDEEWKPVLLLLMECKRHNKKPRERKEMVHQLEGYLQYVFEPNGGKATRGQSIYGAVAYGTQIRAWECFLDGRFVNMAPIWDDYKDPGNPQHAEVVKKFLLNVKALGRRNYYTDVRDPTIGGGSGTGYQLPHLNPTISTGASPQQYSVPYLPISTTGAELSYSSAVYSNQPSSLKETSEEVENLYDAEDDTPMENVSKIIVEVTVRRERHTFQPDEIFFNDVKGKKRRTRVINWQEVKYNGKRAWMFEGNTTNYVCMNLG